MELTGYWAERLRDGTDIETLNRANWLFLKENEMSERYEEISLEILRHMIELKELSINFKNATDWQHISALVSLIELSFWGKEIDSDMAGYIAEIPKLKSLQVNSLTISAPECLAAIKNIKQLFLRGVSGITSENITKFVNLTRLEAGELDAPISPGIGKLNKLTKLALDKTCVENLAFLAGLKNLTSFVMPHKIDNDDDIYRILPTLKKIKVFEYPLTDLATVKECPKLEAIAVYAKNPKNLDAVEGTMIKSVKVIDAESESEARELLEKIGKYRRLTETGYNRPWLEQ